MELCRNRKLCYLLIVGLTITGLYLSCKMGRKLCKIYIHGMLGSQFQYIHYTSEFKDFTFQFLKLSPADKTF